MKRLLWAVVLLLTTTGPAFSQKIRSGENPDELFYLANEQFREKEYPGCYRTISTWFEQSGNPLFLEEASFLKATVSYELNKRDASQLLIRFIKDFPVSAQLSRAYYLLGCTALNAGQWEDALSFFKRCPEQILKEDEINEYRFRFAYAALQLKDYDTARTLFTNITRAECRYVPSATYFLAYMNYAEGKIKEAGEGFQKVSDQEQYRNVTDYFNLQLLYIEGRLEEMTSKADSMLRVNPTPEQKTELVRLLGAAWFDRKKYNLSMQYYQEYTALTSEIHRSDLYRIGINYYTQLNYVPAINYLTQACGSEDAITQSAVYHIGLCYLKQTKKDQARMSFEQASNMAFDKPTQEKALYNYALLCYQDSYSPFNEQARAFQRILTEFPNSQFSASVSNFLSDVYLSSKDYAGSLTSIDSLPAPGDKMLQTKCRLLFLYGVEKYHAQAFDEAQQLFTKAALLAMEKNFPSTEILYWKGETNYKLGLMKEAYDDFKAFTQDPAGSKLKAYPIASYQLGYTCFNLKQYPDARGWFEKYTTQKGVKKDNIYTDALNRIGDCYFLVKDITRAENAYQAAQTSIKGGSDYATFQLAVCQGARNQVRNKIDMLRGFERKFPQSVMLDKALLELGMAQMDQELYLQAEETFLKIQTQCKETPTARKAAVEIAGIRQKEGKTEEAIQDYKNVIEQYPGSEEAQRALKGLKSIFVNSNTVSSYLNYTAGLRGIVKIETGEEDTLAYKTAEQAQTEGKTDEAMQGYRFYLTNFPSGAFRTDSHFQMGRLLLTSGKTQEGQTELDSVASRTGHKYQIPATRMLAESYFSGKDYAMALSTYQQLEALAPDRSTRLAATLGIVRCSYSLELYRGAIDMANRLLSDENPGTDIQRECLYYRGLSLMKDGQSNAARADFTQLSSELQTPFGAEARFRLAECFYKEDDDKEAEKTIQDFLTEGTAQVYWLARASILMVDICIKRGSLVQAKQYLNSLKQNYTVKNDIQDMIADRLNTLSKRSN